MSCSYVQTAVLAGLSIVSQACHGDAQPGFRMMAPAFDGSHIRFTSYDLQPVGVFAAKRGDRMPFIDANEDGSFNQGVEAGGRCDQGLRECQIDDHRLRIMSLDTNCPLTTGLWMIGDVYDHTGRNMAAVLCDEHGNCSKTHEAVFGNTPVNAIWMPDPLAITGPQRLSLSAGLREVRFDDVELPGPVHLERTEITRHDDLHIALTADQSVDMVAVRVMRGRALHWSSSQEPTRLHANEHELIIDLPAAVVDSCGHACEAYVQLGHVWRDDEVFSISQVEHKFSLGTSELGTGT